ncbi:ATP-binding protein [Limnohabitans sp. Rim8]|uniref:sensor histidine kinase n=1 Tax=Limnohabitans sp. Rim8 TaxID=1100718 RepID=UPI0026378165|nr:ATP-binding protein [Limnohabitans sp. Rim8]
MATNFDFQGLFWPTLAGQIRFLPIYILQLVGAMGLFSFTLIVIRDKTKNIPPSILYGVVFGITGYFMTGLVAEFLGSQFKPYIRLELVFWVSMLGGWPAGLITGGLTFLARLQFGGMQLWMISGLETLIFLAAGALLHPWSTRRDLLAVKLKDVLWITTFKTGVGLLSIYALHRGWPDAITEPTLLIFVTNRLMVFPIFFGMTYGLLMILTMDAQHQLHYRLQVEQLAARLQASKQREQQFLAISHSLKTPITRLRLRLALLEDEPLQEDFEADLSALDDRVRFAMETLRNPDGQEEYLPTRLDLLVAQLVAEPIYPDACIDTQLEPLTLSLQPKTMQRAIGNLMDNGILYGQRLSVHLRLENQVVLLTVRDYGPGIAAVDMAKVFLPNVRLEYAQQVNTKGTGLGLSISRNVVRAHGGDISLRNHPEGGLVVQVQLPWGDLPSS